MKLKMNLGLALLALCVPALTLAVPTKDELLLKSMPAGASAKVAAQSKADEAQSARVMELRAQKKALFAQRRALARAHDKNGREANMKAIMQVNTELKKAGQGGAK
ncbi:MAG: hypothetical protein EG825_14695 [Rhodocyclaceae bacterium]|nr:hypothetical protein [Rhodocyclaceae bacterium]